MAQGRRPFHDRTIVEGRAINGHENQNLALRLPASLKAAAVRLSKEDGTSVNQFVVTAVAEKISAINTTTFFGDRRARMNRVAFLCIINRKGGVPPTEEDMR